MTEADLVPGTRISPITQQAKTTIVGEIIAYPTGSQVLVKWDHAERPYNNTVAFITSKFRLLLDPIDILIEAVDDQP